MPYDHSNKIGNQGDLVKHAVLTACLRQLLATSKDDFVYAETHAGRPEYVLPTKGEWTRGIGGFSLNDAIDRDRDNRKEGIAGPLSDELRRYDDLFVGGPLSAGAKYLGSTGMAFRLLRDSGRAFQMRLWETDGGAHDDLVRYYRAWEQVQVAQSDGYDGLPGLEAGMVLVDPPKLDRDETDTLIQCFDRLPDSTPFLLWVPRASAYHGESQPPTESKASREFPDVMNNWSKCIGLQWYKWGHRTPGCWLAVSPDLEDTTSKVAKEVADIMGWTVA